MTISGANPSAHTTHALQTAKQAPPVLKQEAAAVAVGVEMLKKANENGDEALNLLLSTVAGLGTHLNVKA